MYFSNPTIALTTCDSALADGKVICPTCGCETVKFSEKRRTWTCAKHHAKREFSIKVGTIMEDSPIPLGEVADRMWLITNCKNGICSYEIARDVKVTQKTAWFMLHRIRLAMQEDFFGSKLERRSGSRRNFHRRQGAEHARLENASAASRARAEKIKLP